MRTAKMNPDLITEQFDEGCSEEDVYLACCLLHAEPIGPSNTPTKLTAVSFGRVRKIYITTIKDKEPLLDVQERMYIATQCERVSGHAPFIAAPEELVAHLLSV